MHGPLNVKQALKAERSSALSLASVLDGDGWPTLRPGRFTPGKSDPVPTIQEAVWAPRQSGRVQKISPTHRDSIPGLSSP